MGANKCQLGELDRRGRLRGEKVEVGDVDAYRSSRELAEHFGWLVDAQWESRGDGVSAEGFVKIVRW
jgi:hypothetical protein